MSIYGLLIGIAFILCFELFSKKNNIIPKSQENIFFILLFVFSILGARIYGLIANWNYFFQNPIQILNLRGGGLGIFGGLLGGIIFTYVFSYINHLSFLKITNLLVPYVALGQSIGRLGNFFNQEIYGLNHQPIWLYESILMFILFLAFKKIKVHQTGIYLICYGLVRFFLEFIRLDRIPIYFLSLAQILSLLFIIFGFIIIKYENSRH